MRSAFSRNLTAAALVLLAALLILGVSFRILIKDFMTRRQVNSLQEYGKTIAELVERTDVEDPQSVLEFRQAITVANAVSDADAVICDENGRLVLCAESPLGCEHVGLILQQDYLLRALENGGCSDTGTVSGLYDEVRHVVSVPFYDSTGAAAGLVIVSIPVGSTSAVIGSIIEIFVFLSILVVVVSVVAMFFSARQQSAPLRDMAKAASAFGHGDFTARVSTDGRNSREIEELTLAFNNMASSLQKSEYQRQEFVANVSHELKTPMTTISGYVDGILDGTIPADGARAYLALVSDETKRLSRLVRSMLDISRLQDSGGIPESRRTRFDLTECAGRTLLSFEQKATAKALEVEVDMPEHPVYTFAEADSVTQVIYNLVDNAVKFSPQGGRLTLSLREGGSKVYVSVSNEGETIPPEELPLVFDRFHKIDKSRSVNRDSWGLGLYIVKTIVCSHGEDISVTSRDGVTTFTFTMPLAH